MRKPLSQTHPQGLRPAALTAAFWQYARWPLALVSHDTKGTWLRVGAKAGTTRALLAPASKASRVGGSHLNLRGIAPPCSAACHRGHCHQLAWTLLLGRLCEPDLPCACRCHQGARGSDIGGAQLAASLPLGSFESVGATGASHQPAARDCMANLVSGRVVDMLSAVLQHSKCWAPGKPAWSCSIWPKPKWSPLERAV